MVIRMENPEHIRQATDLISAVLKRIKDKSCQKLQG